MCAPKDFIHFRRTCSKGLENRKGPGNAHHNRHVVRQTYTMVRYTTSARARPIVDCRQDRQNHVPPELVYCWKAVQKTATARVSPTVWRTSILPRPSPSTLYVLYYIISFEVLGIRLISCVCSLNTVDCVHAGGQTEATTPARRHPSSAHRT